MGSKDSSFAQRSIRQFNQTAVPLQLATLATYDDAFMPLTRSLGLCSFCSGQSGHCGWPARSRPVCLWSPSVPAGPATFFLFDRDGTRAVSGVGRSPSSQESSLKRGALCEALEQLLLQASSQACEDVHSQGKIGKRADSCQQPSHTITGSSRTEAGSNTWTAIIS